MFEFTMFDLVYVLVACLFIMHAQEIGDMCLDTLARIGGYHKRRCETCGSKFEPMDLADEGRFCSTHCSAVHTEEVWKAMLRKRVDLSKDETIAEFIERMTVGQVVIILDDEPIATADGWLLFDGEHPYPEAA